MRIREYGPEDVPAMVELHARTVRTMNSRHYNAEQIAAWTAPTLFQWRKSLAKSAFALVAEEGEKIIGLSDLRVPGASEDGSSVFLRRLYVDADYIGRGIGAELLEEIERRAKIIDRERIFLHSTIGAHGFYLRQRYVGDSLVRIAIQDDPNVEVDVYFMEKELE